MLTFVAIGLSTLAIGSGLAWYAHRRAGTPSPVESGSGAASGGRTNDGESADKAIVVTNPVINVNLPPLILGVEEPPSKPQEPAVPGTTPDNPGAFPVAGTFYWVKTGDTGSAIVRDAYDVPAGGGNRVRAWEVVRKHAQNRTLSRNGLDTWSGDLLPQHQAPGQHRFGTGKKFPVIWLPPKPEVHW